MRQFRTMTWSVSRKRDFVTIVTILISTSTISLLLHNPMTTCDLNAGSRIIFEGPCAVSNSKQTTVSFTSWGPKAVCCPVARHSTKPLWPMEQWLGEMSPNTPSAMVNDNVRVCKVKDIHGTVKSNYAEFRRHAHRCILSVCFLGLVQRSSFSNDGTAAD